MNEKNGSKNKKDNPAGGKYKMPGTPIRANKDE